ncbi:hypothetical protein N7519_007191 [Penicillium mononematosum]|uniref:uncharacterized protein n=1 Tax=Penicillium mononematosum TaxID=268346 RepID=UPI0025498238|nr:uncharacterized protein N7519_007191 [Penicillium mononematosum]KAJ6185890.1 hypothetical protein N7519_007191 [Penicillium mononematosum]
MKISYSSSHQSLDDSAYDLVTFLRTHSLTSERIYGDKTQIPSPKTIARLDIATKGIDTVKMNIPGQFSIPTVQFAR